MRLLVLRSLGYLIAAGHVCEQLDDISLQDPDISLDHLQRARRLVLVEVPIEWDLVADLGLALVNPRVGNMRQYFSIKVSLNALLERYGLGVAQFRVGLWVAVSGHGRPRRSRHVR